MIYILFLWYILTNIYDTKKKFTQRSKKVAQCLVLADLRWLLQQTELRSHKKVYASVKFTDTEFKFDVIVDECHSPNTL